MILCEMILCEKFWLKMNGKLIAALIVTLPMAVLCPELSVCFLGMALFLSGRWFLVTGTRTNYHDALRLLLTLPFSRKEIFRTYNKGMLCLGGGYIMILAVIRGILMMSGVSYSIGFLHIFTGADLAKYLLILIIYSLIICILQISLLQLFTQSKFGSLLCAFLVLALPMFYSLFYLKIILTVIFTDTITRVVQYFNNLDQLIDTGFPESITRILTIDIYSMLIASFIILLRYVWVRAKRSFCWEEIKC